MGRRRISVSLLGLFGLVAYLASSSSPINTTDYLPVALNFGYFAIPISWLVLVLGFIPVALGLLPEGDTSVEV